LKKDEILSKSLERNFIDDKGLTSVSNIILEIVEILSKYFMTHSLPKNIYDHPTSTL
jgi:hypothetical protein